MDTVIVRGGKGTMVPHQPQKPIDFSNLSDEIRVNYAEIALKSRLTEELQTLSKTISEECNTKLDLINIVDNISSKIILSNFINIPMTDNNISVLGNMIFNEINRMIVYLKTLYQIKDGYDAILLRINGNKTDIASSIIYVLGKFV